MRQILARVSSLTDAPDHSIGDPTKLGALY
jgi:hypothetical protein